MIRWGERAVGASARGVLPWWWVTHDHEQNARYANEHGSGYESGVLFCVLILSDSALRAVHVPSQACLRPIQRADLIVQSASEKYIQLESILEAVDEGLAQKIGSDHVI
jgi:hypothetical protein